MVLNTIYLSSEYTSLLDDILDTVELILALGDRATAIRALKGNVEPGAYSATMENHKKAIENQRANLERLLEKESEFTDDTMYG